MGQEIERKFLLSGDDWKAGATSTRFRQGFLSTEPERAVRVRLAGESGTLTIKGKTEGATRLEFEYSIPRDDAAHLLDALCLRPLIEKVRYLVPVGPHTWEIDVFEGDNAGLVVAEIELASEDEAFERPPWIGEEVTHDPRYFNANLVQHPYRLWRRDAS
ncbi:MAG: CYTH domain-containing protein [Myxococcota bacterium]